MSGTSLRAKLRSGARAANPRETALYTYDMLMSLKRLAELNKQAHLAYLIECAAGEAQTVARGKKPEQK